IGNFSALLMYIRGRTRFAKVYNIPYNKIHKYGMTAQKSYVDQNPLEGKKMLFDILKEKNINYYASEWPLISTNKKTKLKPLLKNEKKILQHIIKKLETKDFVFAHI